MRSQKNRASQGLSKKERIEGREFLRTKRCQRLSTDHFIILLSENEHGYRRLGVSVGKKAGSSVSRNYIKRLLREVFRKNKLLFPQGKDIYIIYKKETQLDVGFSEIEKELINIFKNL